MGLRGFPVNAGSLRDDYVLMISMQVVDYLFHFVFRLRLSGWDGVTQRCVRAL